MFVFLTEIYVRAAVRARDILHMAACGVLCAQLAVVPANGAAIEQFSVALPASALSPALPSSAAGADAKKLASDPVLKVMQTELSRANMELGKTDQAPYYLSYTIYDQDSVVLVGAYGSLLTDAAAKRRQPDITTRGGSHP